MKGEVQTMHSQYDFVSDISARIQQFSRNKFWAEASVSIDSALKFQLEGLGDVYVNAEPEIKILTTRKEDLFKLAMIVWELPEICKYYVLSELEKVIPNQYEFTKIRLSLKSKAHRDLVLQSHLQEMHNAQIFGNFLDKNNWSSEVFSRIVKLKIRKSSADVKQPKHQKRTIGVGYKDKGHLPEKHSPGTEPFVDSRKHRQIEEHRKSISDTDLLIEGFLI